MRLPNNRRRKRRYPITLFRESTVRPTHKKTRLEENFQASDRSIRITTHHDASLRRTARACAVLAQADAARAAIAASHALASAIVAAQRAAIAAPAGQVDRPRGICHQRQCRASRRRQLEQRLTNQAATAARRAGRFHRAGPCRRPSRSSRRRAATRTGAGFAGARAARAALAAARTGAPVVIAAERTPVAARASGRRAARRRGRHHHPGRRQADQGCENHQFRKHDTLLEDRAFYVETHEVKS